MRLILALAILAISATANAQQLNLSSRSRSPISVSVEGNISGMNKICYDDCLGSSAAITVKSYELCPLNIESD